MNPTPDFSIACESLANALQNIPEFILTQAKHQNPWFEIENSQMAANAWINLLQPEKINAWLNPYSSTSSPKNVAIIMAGNIPFVGLHDLITVIASGNKALCKLSSDDTVLMKYCINILNGALLTPIEIVERVTEADAIIATGSNNTAKIFESYFKNIPHIIRRNRTSIAVLNGHETKDELQNMGVDLFSYFGLGCRNISKIFVPEGYDFSNFFEAIFSFGNIINHHKYANNYDYNKAIYLMGNEKFLDNNFLMLRRDTEALHSPLAVLFYDNYATLDDLQLKINNVESEIQCVSSKVNLTVPRQVSLGKTQNPELNDYADGVDTLAFLNGLK